MMVEQTALHLARIGGELAHVQASQQRPQIAQPVDQPIGAGAKGEDHAPAGLAAIAGQAHHRHRVVGPAMERVRAEQIVRGRHPDIVDLDASDPDRGAGHAGASLAARVACQVWRSQVAQATECSKIE